ncbi:MULTISPECIES: RHS repeat-associated core domain-containing protein [unclassified Pseudomonas]|uniref:RHS repeat-associated core domain-containing protein n=1 Tax=unclassified Pseudomonas TaxID=196821 RepID=UPI0012948F04|nr:MULTISPECIES: RHS repeat-associated core domain-containing protein [unclassified Pseudomonas]MQT55320.1 RHS repeat-associated core domain-containing protein [Pseudomonas sp. FSL R10-2398]MQU00830.1 RHS repeat-associated core domain-containing protein [Pseudomonas sp. FSL R10-2245]MQU12587.1 RHS repeat-associated core domain-containing protein [Pseudomonas sp. FSL R10-2189]MQU40030.1 RHS repeat-associated core domain-containing protein [Pseudomonas sp. FSL R10-2172]
MSKQRKTVASTYLYDPLDRLAASNSIQRFYNDTRIATEVEGDRKSRFFETDSQPLALQQQGSLPGTTLLATDQQTSVLNGVSPEGALHAQAYSPFGHHPIGTSLNGAGFNGERPEPLTGHYLLGQGYRAFNPVLMRFNSPDSWSPFGDGGINAYAYCTDPIMEIDPTGHAGIWGAVKGLLKLTGLRKTSVKKIPRVVSNLKSESINPGLKANQLYADSDIYNTVSYTTSATSRPSISSSRIKQIQARPLPSLPSESSLSSNYSSLANSVSDNLYDDIIVLKNHNNRNYGPQFKSFLDSAYMFSQNKNYDPYVNLISGKWVIQNHKTLTAQKIIRRGKDNNGTKNPQ